MSTLSATDLTPAAPRRIVLLVSGERAEMMREAKRLLPIVARYADAELLDLSVSQDLSAVEFDLALVLGGDGSMLRAAHHMGRHQRPVLGVNLGKVGFLADVAPDELVAQLPNICSGQLPIVEHLMFDCRLQRGGQAISERLGLNEVAVLAGPPFALLYVDLYVDSELVTTYSCDGLILSTPVGSTAHSLSAGGPILRQDLQAFVISPISPHTLTNRPVVDSADRVYELVVSRPHAGTSLVIDGMVVAKLEPQDRIHVQRAEARFKLLAVPGHSYYRTLREKLGWGGRLLIDSGP
jgi:NAD+ kinase